MQYFCRPEILKIIGLVGSRLMVLLKDVSLAFTISAHLLIRNRGWKDIRIRRDTIILETRQKSKS